MAENRACDGAPSPEVNYCLIEQFLWLHEKAMAKRYFDIYRDGLLKNLGSGPDPAFMTLLEGRMT